MKILKNQKHQISKLWFNIFTEYLKLSLFIIYDKNNFFCKYNVVLFN